MLKAYFFQNDGRIDHAGGLPLAWCNFNAGELEAAHSWIDGQFDFYRWGGAVVVKDDKVIASRSRAKWLYEARPSLTDPGDRFDGLA